MPRIYVNYIVIIKSITRCIKVCYALLLLHLFIPHLVINLIVLCESLTFGINGSFASPEKKFSINFNKASTAFCLSLHYNADNSHLFVDGKEIFNFKGDNKIVKFPTQICCRSISNGSISAEFREVSLNGNVYDFSVDYNSINKSAILDIQKYLMIKNNIK